MYGGESWRGRMGNEEGRIEGRGERELNLKVRA